MHPYMRDPLLDFLKPSSNKAKGNVRKTSIQSQNNSFTQQSPAPYTSLQAYSNAVQPNR